jgi:hypothetical protein
MAGDELKPEGAETSPPSHRRPRRWLGAGLAVVVVAVIVIFAVAQGGGSGSGPLDAIAKAAEVTQREPGGHALLEASILNTSTPEGIMETGSMIFDDRGMARGVISVKGRSTGKEVKALVIGKGTTSYTSSEAFESLPEGKKWLEIDIRAGSGDAASTGPSASSPKEGLKLLEGVNGAEEVGKEDVRGVPTTHYRGTITAPEEVFGVKVHVSAMNVDVWIDGQERVRRIEMAYSTAVDGAEDSATTTKITINYVSFGRVPKIELPNPDEVFNATSEVESDLQSATEGH